MSNRISAKPPSLTNKEAKNNFIKGSEDKVTPSIDNSSLPWNRSNIRNDVKKAFTVQLPEEYILKLQYIKEHTNQSQQRIVRESIINSVDEILKSFINKD